MIGRDIGRTARAIRLEQGLSQAQVAELLGWARAVYSRFESGKYYLPRLDRVMAVAEVLGVPSRALLDEALDAHDRAREYGGGDPIVPIASTQSVPCESSTPRATPTADGRSLAGGRPLRGDEATP